MSNIEKVTLTQAYDILIDNDPDNHERAMNILSTLTLFGPSFRVGNTIYEITTTAYAG